MASSNWLRWFIQFFSLLFSHPVQEHPGLITVVPVFSAGQSEVSAVAGCSPLAKKGAPGEEWYQDMSRCNSARRKPKIAGWRGTGCDRACIANPFRPPSWIAQYRHVLHEAVLAFRYDSLSMAGGVGLVHGAPPASSNLPSKRSCSA